MIVHQSRERGGGRAAWHWRANAVVVGYLAATLVAMGFHVAGRTSAWLPVHILLLGAATNAIVVWTLHFTTTLLHPAQKRAPRYLPRLVILNIAVLGIVSGASMHRSVLVVLAAALFGVVIVSHGWFLLCALVTMRAPRFAVTAWFYCAALVALMFGATAGTALSVGVQAGWYTRLLAAHVHANVFGWIALTVLGTQVAFWPMVLRTRIGAGTESAARQAFPLCAGGLALTLAGLMAGGRPLAIVGLAGYIAGAARTLEPFVRTAAARPPRTPAAWMLAAATGWLVVALVTDLATVVRAAGLAAVAVDIEQFVPWVLAGFVAQVLMGALTYLLPVVLGGGPAGGRRIAIVLDRWGFTRVTAFNIGVVLVALRLPPGVTRIGWACVAAAAGSFVVLAAAAFRLTRAHASGLPVQSPMMEESEKS